MYVTFKLKYANTKLGQSVFVVGETNNLGNWKKKQALPLQTNDRIYPKWITQDHILISEMNNARKIEYKYIIQKDDFSDDTVWESNKKGAYTKNRIVDLSCYFDYNHENHVIIEDQGFNNFGPPHIRCIYEDDIESQVWTRNNRSRFQEQVPSYVNGDSLDDGISKISCAPSIFAATELGAPNPYNKFDQPEDYDEMKSVMNDNLMGFDILVDHRNSKTKNTPRKSNQFTKLIEYKPLPEQNILAQLGDLYQTEYSKTPRLNETEIQKVESQRNQKSQNRSGIFEQIGDEQSEEDVDKDRRSTEEAYEFDFSDRSGSSRNMLHQEMSHVRSILKHKLQESQAPSIDNVSKLSSQDDKQSIDDSEEQNELSDLNRNLKISILTDNHQLDDFNRELDLQHETDLHEQLSPSAPNRNPNQAGTCAPSSQAGETLEIIGRRVIKQAHVVPRQQEEISLDQNVEMEDVIVLRRDDVDEAESILLNQIESMRIVQNDQLLKINNLQLSQIQYQMKIKEFKIGLFCEKLNKVDQNRELKAKKQFLTNLYTNMVNYKTKQKGLVLKDIAKRLQSDTQAQIRCQKSVNKISSLLMRKHNQKLVKPFVRFVQNVQEYEVKETKKQNTLKITQLKNQMKLQTQQITKYEELSIQKDAIIKGKISEIEILTKRAHDAQQNSHKFGYEKETMKKELKQLKITSQLEEITKKELELKVEDQTFQISEMESHKSKQDAQIVQLEQQTQETLEKNKSLEQKLQELTIQIQDLKNKNQEKEAEEFKITHNPGEQNVISDEIVNPPKTEKSAIMSLFTSFLVNSNKKQSISSTKKIINIQDNAYEKKIESIEESKEKNKSSGGFGTITPNKKTQQSLFI